MPERPEAPSSGRRRRPTVEPGGRSGARSGSRTLPSGSSVENTGGWSQRMIPIPVSEPECRSQMPLEIQSSAFNHNGAIPLDHTCEGKDTAPPLRWSGAPAETKSFAFIVDDPDAPDPKAPKMTYVHWVLYDIPPGATRPVRARDGKNDWKREGYGGPCPPIGRHRYFFKLYAIDVMLGDLYLPTKQQLLDATK